MKALLSILDRFDDVVKLCAYAWPLTVAPIINVIAAAVVTCPFRREYFRRSMVVTCICFLVGPFILISGEFMGSTLAWPFLAGALFVVQMAAMIWSLAVGRQLRWFLFSIGICHLLFTIACWVIVILNETSGGNV
jgi:hypothetical protein